MAPSESRSPPAKKVFFADVTTTPVMVSRSAASRSSTLSMLRAYASFIVFAERLGSSSVSTTTPSSCRSHRMVSLTWVSSDPLDDRRDAHAAADTQRRQPVAQLAALQLVQQRAEEHSAGGT